MNPIIDAACRKYDITPLEFFGPKTHGRFSKARREAIQNLYASGMIQSEIARTARLHIQSVYYWTRPNQRRRRRKYAKLKWHLDNKIGGPRQTKQQRAEILSLYLQDRARGTALAVSRGLSPLYAYKLANAMGLLPLKGEPRMEGRA